MQELAGNGGQGAAWGSVVGVELRDDGEGLGGVDGAAGTVVVLVALGIGIVAAAAAVAIAVAAGVGGEACGAGVGLEDCRGD